MLTKKFLPAPIPVLDNLRCICYFNPTTPQFWLHPSSSSFASPSFIVPKKDPKAIPCWVSDYQQLNVNMIPDNYPLPHISEILADCGKGKI